MGGVGPMFGQVHHFKRAAKERVPYAIDRYYRECRRLYGVLDARLQGRDHLAGALSIADFATLPWVFRHDWQEVDLGDFPNVKRWYEGLMARPGGPAGNGPALRVHGTGPAAAPPGRRRGEWCRGEDLNLHGVAPTST